MRTVIPLLVAAAVIGVMVWQRLEPETVLMPAPAVVFPEIAGMTWEDGEMTEVERGVLPADTLVVRRRYAGPDGHWYVVSAVVGGRSKSSVHRPELCLPGQGFRMSEPHDLDAEGVRWRKLIVERGADGRGGFAYTFSNGTGLRTASHFVRILTDVWDRSVRGRIDRWVMLTVLSSRADDPALAAFLGKLKGVVKCN